MPQIRSLSWLVLASALASTPLAAQADWTALTPTNVPGGRTGHAMAYDIVRDEIVLFGGNISGLGFQSDTWIYDGTTWTQVFPVTTPSARAGHPMAYDPLRNRTVMYGGIPTGGGAILADTWEWDGSDWTLFVPATAPPPKRSQPMIYYPIRGTIVMWGGHDGTSDTSDTWEFNGLDWQPIVTASAPAPRRATDMAFDPNTGGMVLFSGYLQGSDTWLFNGVDWVALTPATVPPGRYDHTLATDFVRNRVVMFGGTTFSDTWEWDGVDWIQRTPSNPPLARYDDYLVWDNARERIVMFGGLAGNPDMWEYRTNAPGTFVAYGSGCLGSGGIAPALSSPDRPWVGESLNVRVDSLLPTAPVFMFVGFSNTFWSGIPLPYDLSSLGMTGCFLLAEPLVAPQLPNSGGSAQLSLAVPSGPALAGLDVYFQAITADPRANPFGAAVSNGGAAHLGLK